ncbi:hypothetical protein SLUN_38930 (plasmid) [Streptomyces lunaelactis]|uniref:Uncharacterized protein n=1 Tax=Streptomyces lunaelactis TaxID=1535768 RepID=A0A2R4TFX2_9ACTN|nr:hypothetical protein [Streptomyces lunaelactis]AVZ78006.1 hypothetical protein SLUN_38930 [Streptomyces lunaelactis]NUK84919.1 hypothetical protein [Streptomyces lunaelactis]
MTTMGARTGVTAKRRRCEYRRCRRLLPRDAPPRRRYCGPNCVAAAYRLRRRSERVDHLMTTVISAKAAEFFETTEGYHDRLLAWQRCAGPSCGVVLWAGARRRSNARFCSARCRQAAYRVRKRARADHDAVP